MDCWRDGLGEKERMGCSVMRDENGTKVSSPPMCVRTGDIPNTGVCKTNNDCVSNICVEYAILGISGHFCNDLCCSDSQCPNNRICEYVVAPNDANDRPVRECIYPFPPGSRGGLLLPCCVDHPNCPDGYHCAEVSSKVFEWQSTGPSNNKTKAYGQTTSEYLVHRCVAD